MWPKWLRPRRDGGIAGRRNGETGRRGDDGAHSDEWCQPAYPRTFPSRSLAVPHPHTLSPAHSHTEGRQGEGTAAALRRLRWTVLRPLASQLGGDERSLLRGPGVEVDELREYQPGDDVRHIDWNVTAREDRPYVRESRAERALDVLLVLDASASVDWGTAQCLKRDRLVDFAAVAGQLLSGHGNRVGALLFADRPLDFVPPGAGRGHLVHLVERVRRTPRQSGRGATNLAAVLGQANALLKRRALVLVVSDFLPETGWQDALAKLTQRHEVVAVRLRDPREFDLPDVGLVTLEDPETGSQLIVDTADRRLRERFAGAALAQSERIRADLARHGVDQLVLSTDQALLPALVTFLESRRHRRSARVRV